MQETAALPAAPPPKRGHRLWSVLSTLGILLIAPLVAVGLTAFVFQSYQVSGQSMQPTLQNDDRLVIWKLPRTWSHLTGHAFVPARGDVIVVKTSRGADVGLDPAKQIIKRVVGLPGDRVVVKDGILTVYNASHRGGFQPDKTLPYGKAIESTNNDGTWQIGQNELFVCGDNRLNSADSRIFGPISTSDVVGKLVLRVLPISKSERF